MKNNSIEAIPLIVEFCHWLNKEGKSPSTITTYKRELEKYQEWLQERNEDITKLTKANIESYINYLEQEQKSAATIDKKIGAIRTFTKFLEKPELIFGITLKSVEKEDYETLSSEDYDTLLKEVKEDENLRDIAIVYVLLHTGIRVSELCSLNWSHVDFDNNELNVVKNTERRIIPLSNDVKKHLSNYRQSVPSSEAAVFISKTGERITERTVQYMLKKYNVNPNLMRHTFCQRLVDSNVDLEIVSRLAGIKDLNVTKRYLKQSKSNKSRLEEVINNTFIRETLG